MSDLHPYQREMLRLEAAFEKQGPPPGPPIDQCIAQLVGFTGDVDGELDPILNAEANRAVRLANGHYREWAQVTPLTTATIGFLQGVTFAAAVRNVERSADGQAEYHHVTVSRDDDDYLTIEGKEVNVLRASVGGTDDVGGYYLVFRGEPEKVVKMLEMMTEAAKDMLPRGQYKDKRKRKGRR